MILITPTADREAFFPPLYEALCQQTYQKWEWWICDTSWRPSPFLTSLQDPRLHYHFRTVPLSIGEKRNWLIEESRGDWILHIDDDDHYAPGYIAHHVACLEKSDFCALTSWFAYDLKIHQGFYWNTDEPVGRHYQIGPLMGKELQGPVAMRPKVQQIGATGYGFTYGYHRTIWQNSPFPPQDYQEDHHFFSQLKTKKKDLKSDEEGLVVKMIHDLNVSGIFPQYRLPLFLLHHKIPTFASHALYLTHHT